MLNVSKLCSGYGAIRALTDLDLSVPAHGFVALIGSNGAGKSTAMNTIAGLHKPTSGTVTLGGEDITGVTAHRAVQRGLAIVPEGRMVAPPLTVEENLELTRFARRDRSKHTEALDFVYDLFPRLADRRLQHAGLLSGGEQQMLALGRALMTQPRVMLLDEPSMGLAPAIVDDVFEAIGRIRQLDLRDSPRRAERGACSRHGRLRLRPRTRHRHGGQAADLAEAPAVMNAYLG